MTEVEKKSAKTPVFNELTLTTVSNEKIDISSQLSSIEIYEDLYSPVITGRLCIIDNINMFHKLPICGEEKVTIKFQSYNYDVDKNLKLNFFHRTFDVVKISNIEQINDYTMQYILELASPELKKNETIRISKAYRGKSISAIVSSILTNDYDTEQPTGLGFPVNQISEKIQRSPYISDSDIEVNYEKIDEDDSVELFVEKTKFIEPCITIPFMKPFDIISWLSSRAIRSCGGRNKESASSDSANFLFFENKRGFQFTSLDTLLENKEFINTTFKFGNAEQNVSSSGGRLSVMNIMENLQIQDCYDVLNNIRGGLYASKLFSYDLVTGNVYEKDYNYIDTFATTESTDRGVSKSPPVKIWDNISDYPLMKINKDGNNILAKKPDSKHMLSIFNPTAGVDIVTSNPTERNCTIRDEIGSQAYIQKRLNQLGKWALFRVTFDTPGNSVHTVGNCIKLDIKDFDYYTNSYGTFRQKDSNFYNGYYLITALKHTVTKDKYTMTIEAAKDSSSSIIFDKSEI